MKNIFTYKFLFAAFTGCVFLCSCENSEDEVNSFNQKKIGVEEGKDIRVTFTNGGKSKAVLTAPLMLRVGDTAQYTEFPKTIFVNFYNEEGKIESTLKANYAKYRESQSIVFLKDSVRVINIAQGDTLYCRELYWDRNRIGNEFFTDKAVRVRTKTQIIDGTGLNASQDFKNWLITYPTGIINVPKASFPQ